MVGFLLESADPCPLPVPRIPGFHLSVR